MKTIKNSIIAILAIFAVSCNMDDVENRPTVQATGDIVLSAPEEGNAYVLTEDNADVLAERFVWSEGNFGEGIIPNYELEIDLSGNNFAAPQIIASTTGTTQVAVSQNVLNTAVMALGVEPEVSSTFNVRIKGYVGDQVIYSNAVEISVTPYVGVVPLPQMFMVGDATENAWNNTGNTPLFRDNDDQNLFYFTGYFNAGSLKFLSTLGAWQPQYGSGGDGVLAVNDGTGTDPDAITIPTAGYYSVSVNLTDMTYTLTAYDASAATTYAPSAIGLIGDATPTAWDSDTDMTSTTLNPHIWHVSAITLGAGGAKFRANNDWAINWGAATFPAGVGTQDGSNINITADQAGVYDVWFNDLDGRYLFIPQN